MLRLTFSWRSASRAPALDAQICDIFVRCCMLGSLHGDSGALGEYSPSHLTRFVSLRPLDYLNIALKHRRCRISIDRSERWHKHYTTVRMTANENEPYHPDELRHSSPLPHCLASQQCLSFHITDTNYDFQENSIYDGKQVMINHTLPALDSTN